jgi:S1-C subfamily serine protease
MKKGTRKLSWRYPGTDTAIGKCWIIEKITRRRNRMKHFILVTVLTSSVAFGAREMENAVPRRAFEIRDSFVRVQYHLKKDEEETPEESLFEKSIVRRVVEEKQSWEVSGIALDASALILVLDFRPEERYLDRIEVELADGSILPATYAGILLRTPLAVIAPATPPENWSGLKFIEPRDLSGNSRILTARMGSDGKERYISYTPLAPSVRFREEGTVWRPPVEETPSQFYPWFEVLQHGETSPVVFLTSEGEALGCGADHPIDRDEKEAQWIGTTLLEENYLPQIKLDELSRKITEWSDKLIHEVKVVYRLTGETDDSDYYSFLRMYESHGSGGGREFISYGLAVSATQVFVPRHLGWEEAEKIERITVTVGGEERQGTFLGAYKDFGAFLVTVSGEPLTDFTSFDPEAELPPVAPFFTVTVEHRLGGRKTRVRHNRYLHHAKSYRDVYRPDPVLPVRLGSIVIDLEGNPVGVQLRQRKEGEEQDSSPGWSRNLRLYEGLGGGGVLFLGSELTPALRKPEDFFDPNIVQKTKEEAKRRPWLGIEFTSLEKDLAKMWECEKATKDGKRGLVVNHVYPDSSAERLGLKVRDILLSVQDPGHDYPMDLQAPPDHDYFDFMLEDDEDAHSEAPLGFKWHEPPPWRPRENYLTGLLENIGEGKEVKLVYWSDGEEKEATFAVEQAPPDFESAEKHKDETVGLTVKDITYEVTTALQLPPDQPGVVVAKVEPGSAAAVAKVEPYEIIVEVEGRPVDGSEEFKASLEEAEEEGKGTVTLLLLNLGTSRFANLQLKSREESSDQPRDTE